MKIEEFQRREDRRLLYAQPEFRRFLFEILEASAITRIAREGEVALLMEGRRSLGLEILGWFSKSAEPLDVVASAISAAQDTVHKGANNDHRDPDEYPDNRD